jgi:uncharacterized RDD family membrane protein YckC
MSTPSPLGQRNPYAPSAAPVADLPPAGTLQPADRLARLVAVIIDALILDAALVPVFVGSGVDAARSPDPAHPQPGAGLAIGLIVAFLAVIAWAAITIYLVNRNGQTIAKKALGMKVVRTDGSPASLGRIFWLRNVVGTFLLGIIPLYGLVDALMILGDSRRCLHDQVADTIVVKDR